MTTQKREYERIYHDVVDDPDMAPIYANDLAWSTWTKLLLIGGSAWPSSGMLPAGLNRVGLRICVEYGAVIVEGVRFRIRGMDKERAARSEKARRAANALHGGSGRIESEDDDGMQTHPPSSANGMQTQSSSSANGVPSQAKTRRAEQSKDESEQSARELTDEEYVGDAMTEASGLHFSVASRNGDRLMAMVKRSGLPAVLSTLRLVSDDLGPYADQANIVNRVADYLNAAPKPKAPDPEAERERARLARSFEKTRRMEAEFVQAMAEARPEIGAKP
jgi:hypothetical protein